MRWFAAHAIKSFPLLQIHLLLSCAPHLQCPGNDNHQDVDDHSDDDDEDDDCKEELQIHLLLSRSLNFQCPHNDNDDHSDDHR